MKLVKDSETGKILTIDGKISTNCCVFGADCVANWDSNPQEWVTGHSYSKLESVKKYTGGYYNFYYSRIDGNTTDPFNFQLSEWMLYGNSSKSYGNTLYWDSAPPFIFKSPRYYALSFYGSTSHPNGYFDKQILAGTIIQYGYDEESNTSPLPCYYIGFGNSLYSKSWNYLGYLNMGYNSTDYLSLNERVLLYDGTYGYCTTFSRCYNFSDPSHQSSYIGDSYKVKGTRNYSVTTSTGYIKEYTISWIPTCYAWEIWNATTIYNTGNKVVWAGKFYEAADTIYSNVNKEPPNASFWHDMTTDLGLS